MFLNILIYEVKLAYVNCSSEVHNLICFDTFLHLDNQHPSQDADYSRPPLPTGNMLQDPQWMSKTADSTEPYVYYIFLVVHTDL